MRPDICVFNAGSCTNLVQTDVLDCTWLDSFRQSDLLEIQRSSGSKPTVSETGILLPRIGESSLRVTFVIVDKLAISVLLGTIFLEKVMTSIHPAKMTTVIHDNPLAPVIVVHEASSAAEKGNSDNHLYIEEDLALFVALVMKDHQI